MGLVIQAVLSIKDSDEYRQFCERIKPRELEGAQAILENKIREVIGLAYRNTVKSVRYGNKKITFLIAFMGAVKKHLPEYYPYLPKMTVGEFEIYLFGQVLSDNKSGTP